LSFFRTFIQRNNETVANHTGNSSLRHSFGVSVADRHGAPKSAKIGK
jgi:hypothetical protein